MSPVAIRRKDPASKWGEESLDSQFEIVAEAFLESFELLEEYAPVWHTEQHHKRALTACRILDKSKATRGATRSSKSYER
jgi:hypothetical protein